MTPPQISRRAARELREAAAWIAQENPAAAERFVTVVVTASRRLCARPTPGRIELRLAPERYRLWSLRGFSYVLVVDSAADPPHIVRIVHTARDLPAELRDVADPS